MLTPAAYAADSAVMFTMLVMSSWWGLYIMILHIPSSRLPNPVCLPLLQCWITPLAEEVLRTRTVAEHVQLPDEAYAAAAAAAPVPHMELDVSTCCSRRGAHRVGCKGTLSIRHSFGPNISGLAP